MRGRPALDFLFPDDVYRRTGPEDPLMRCQAHRHAIPEPLTSTAGPVVQRKCGCGRATSGGGECSACRKKRQALQRRAKAGAAVHEAPPIVEEVLRSSGQPLDEASRSFFEPRFRRDFSRVRVHTDSRAAQSAEAVDAQAYTVGQHIVFAAGQYVPATMEGRLLLAHELTHVVQQGPLEGQSLAGLHLDGSGPQERQAEAVAARVVRGDPPGPIRTAGTPVLQTQGASGSATPDTGVCGPDVKAPTMLAVFATQKAFDGWTDDQRAEACGSLEDISQLPGRARWGEKGKWVPIAKIAWDIPALHHAEWVQDYRPECATFCKTPTCGFFPGDPGFKPGDSEDSSTAIASVQVDGTCHYAGSLNYVIFGVMCRLCYDHYMEMREEVGAYPPDPLGIIATGYDEWHMLNTIWAYKGDVPLFHGASANYEASKRWASAGWNGWPFMAPAPAGDRPNCAVNVCPHVFGSVGVAKGPFAVAWYPHGFHGDPLLKL
jgi:hypothetical protein